MDCKKADKFLVEYLYQELDPQKTVEIEKHLEACDSCSNTLEQWRQIHQSYQKTLATEGPSNPYLRQRILAAAREESQRAPSLFEKFVELMRPAMVVPVVVVALVVLLVTWGQEWTFKGADEPVVKISEVRPEKPAVRPELKKKSAEPTTPVPEPKRQTLDQETAKDLKNLGYVGEGSEKQDDRSAHIEAGRPEGAMAAPQEETITQRELGKKNEQFEAAPETSLEENEYREDVLQEKPAPPPPAPEVPPPAPAEPAPSSEMANKQQPPKLFYEAQSEFNAGNVRRGKALADRAIEQDKSKDLANQFHQAGIQYQEKREPQQAIVQFTLVLNNYPNYSETPDVLLRLGDSYNGIGQYQKAHQAYQQLASKYPSWKEIAQRKIQELMKQKEAYEQLRALGYVSD